MAKVIRIPAQEAPAIYPSVSHLIQKALDRGHGEIGHNGIVVELANDLKQLWLVTDEQYSILGACITEHIKYESHRIIRMCLLGGSGLGDWSDSLREAVEQFGKDLGCKGVEVIGRKGWIRHLESKGYKPVYYTLRKEI